MSFGLVVTNLEKWGWGGEYSGRQKVVCANPHSHQTWDFFPWPQCSKVDSAVTEVNDRHS
jgi:hypothetical protein